MLQFIKTIADFIQMLVDSLGDLLAFLPQAISYINYFINLLPPFLIPSFSIIISILIFNRISSH